MRLALVTTIGGTLLAASAAEAAFTFRTQRIVGTGTAATAPVGMDRISLIVGENAGNLTIGAIDINIRISPCSPRLGSLRFNADVLEDTVEFLGPQTNNSRRPDAFTNSPNALTFASLPGAFANIETPDTAIPGAAALYAAGLQSFSSASAYEDAPRTFNNAAITPPITSANGIIVASAVVNTGVFVDFNGLIDNDLSAATGITPFNTATLCPEPATLASLVSVAALGLARPRRRGVSHALPSPSRLAPRPSPL